MSISVISHIIFWTRFFFYCLMCDGWRGTAVVWIPIGRARRARFFFRSFGRPPNPLNYLKCLLTWLCQMESRCKKILFCIHIFEPYLILARLAIAVSIVGIAAGQASIGLAKKEARNAEKKLNRFGHQRIYHNPKWKGMHHYNSSVQKSSVIWAQCTAAHARTRHSRAVL